MDKRFYFLVAVVLLLTACENDSSDMAWAEDVPQNNAVADSTEINGNPHDVVARQATRLAEFPLTEEKVPVQEMDMASLPAPLRQTVGEYEERQDTAMVFTGSLHNAQVFIVYDGYLPGHAFHVFDENGKALEVDEERFAGEIDAGSLCFVCPVTLQTVDHFSLLVPYVPVKVNDLPDWIVGNYIALGGKVTRGKLAGKTVYNVNFPFHSDLTGFIYSQDGNMLGGMTYDEFLNTATNWVCLFYKQGDGVPTGIGQIEM